MPLLSVVLMALGHANDIRDQLKKWKAVIGGQPHPMSEQLTEIVQKLQLFINIKQEET